MTKRTKLLSLALVTVMALTVVSGAGVLIASGAQRPARCHHSVPFVGCFSGHSQVIAGGTSDTGTGIFTLCGRSRVEGSQITGTQYPQPYQMTITAANGDTIRLHVPPGSSTYQIDGGTGRFAPVVGGTGRFALQRSTSGSEVIFSGHLDGTIIFAS